MKFEIDLQKLRLKKEQYAYIIIFLAVIFYLTLFFIYIFTPRPQRVTILNINSPDSVIPVRDSIVTPVLYQRIPELDTLNILDRKKKFIEVILPTSLLAQEIIEDKKERIIELKNKKELTPEDSIFLNKMLTRFKATNIDDLLSRIKPIPMSIILAQASTESAWGRSRFCREANNLFGVWSFNKNEKRIPAGKRRDKKTIYLRNYDSPLESILDYFYTIGRSNAFTDFRDILDVSDNPYRLIWFLQNYSEKRLEYVITLRNIIEHNNPSRYDNYVLPEIDKNDKTWKKLVNRY